MVEMPVKLAGIWVAVMLIYLLGDVLRIYSGDVTPGKMGNVQMTQSLWLIIAVLMLTPILMVVLSLTLPQPANRWANIIMAAFFLIFNLVGLPTYPSLYDRFLLAVSLVFNAATIWLAWNWS